MAIAAACMVGLSAWAQQADEQAGKYLNESRWLELRDLYRTDSMQMSPYIRQMAKTMIDYTSNRPRQACQDIRELLGKYQQQMGGANIYTMTNMLIVNYSQAGDNRSAAYVAKQLANQIDSTQNAQAVADMRGKEQLYTALAQYDIHQTDGRDHSVAFDLTPMSDTASVLMTIHGTVNGQPGNFIFDTGAGYNTITPDLARRYGLRIVAGGLEANGTRKIGGQIGLADSITLGDMTIRHVVFAILDIQTGNSRARRAVSKISLILGQPVLTQYAQYTIDMAQRRIHFRTHSDRTTRRSNIYYYNHIPYVEVEQDGRRMAIALDSGADKTTLGNDYYKDFAAYVARYGKWDIQASAGFGGITYDSVFKIPQIDMRIGDRPFSLHNIAVSALSTSNHLSTGYGRLGMDFLQLWRQVTIDNVNMTIYLQP